MRVVGFPEVLAAAQASAEWAFASLYREYDARLGRYFASRAPADAQDLAAETWMGVAARIASFHGGEEQFRAWLFTVAHHQLARHWRATGRRREEPVVAADLERLAGPSDPSGDVVEAMTAQAAVDHITAALSSWPTTGRLPRPLRGPATPPRRSRP